MASISGVINAINKLSKPLQKKVAKKLGIDVEGKPGRKTDSIIVGTDRVAAEKKINKLIGGGIGAGGKIIYDLTKDTDRGKAKADTPPTPSRKPKDLIDKMSAEAKKEKATKQEKKTPKKMFMKEGKTGKDSKVEFKAITGNTGLLASKKDLKPIPAGKKGKGLSMLSTSVRNNMGFMYGGGMPMPSKKPRMSNTDYRKASKGMLIISIDMKKKKKGKGKKA